MRLARWAFTAAGIWGIVVLTPLFWRVDLTGRMYPVPEQYPQFFYGFLVVAMAWQLAFLVIGRDPARFRWLMVPAMVEKFGYVATLAILGLQGRLPMIDVQPAIPDAILGVLFVAAFVATRPAAPPPRP